MWQVNFLFLLELAGRGIATFPTQLIFQTPGGQALENLAVRPSSKLLITSTAFPTLFTLDPTAANPTLDEVFTFPNASALTGIAEYRPDVYAIAAFVFNSTSIMAAPGSVAIWSLDFASGGTPTARRAARIPQSILPNGLSTVPGQPDLVLVADSILGEAFEVNVRTGAVRVLIQDVTMTPIGPNGPAPPLGIDGLHVHDGLLYFTNAQRQTFSRVPLVNGTVETLASGEFDDFTFDTEGRVWVATDPGGLTLFTPLKNGTFEQKLVVDTVLNGTSSAAFGRNGARETKTLYVTTRAGQLVAVDTSGGDA
ncbi:hypothetical protein MSAN_01982400 [Mycena sanguinolenta]|uniref:SMP-30/Gluconolactonase/LRE-like region domain-containing protein n=1 Tax=Mycena sanguinolenta TaxID=230812 RepID=A0A8H7CQC0_9AGAR|nr:hypothetical protein MSAN_01982400 [Mycena sanguinolenta]